MFGAVKFLNVLIFTLLCVLLFNLMKLTLWPLVWERAYQVIICYFVVCKYMSVHLFF